MFINDLFFFHERARKINIWSGFIILSPYFGPLFAAFIISTQKWIWAFWVYTIETALCLVAVILFVDETYYDRRVPRDQQPPRSSRLMRLVGIEQRRTHLLHNTFLQAMMRPVKVLLKPTVFLSTVYYLLTFAWVVGINTTLSIFLTPLYNFGPRQIGEYLLLSYMHRLTSFNRRLFLLHPHCCGPSGRADRPLPPRLDRVQLYSRP